MTHAMTDAKLVQFLRLASDRTGPELIVVADRIEALKQELRNLRRLLVDAHEQSMALRIREAKA